MYRTSSETSHPRGGWPKSGPGPRFGRVRPGPSLRPALLALALAALPGAPGRLHAQGPRLFYEQDGDGVPVVLVPDWAQDTSTWFLVLPGLRPGHRLVRYDLRGQGRSEAPADGDYSLDAERADLERLLRALGVDRAHLVGAGRGGAIALDYAVRHPDRVLSLTLVNPRFGWSDADRGWWSRFLAAYDRVGRPSMGEYASVLVERWVGTNFATANPWVVAFYDLVLRRERAGPLVDGLRAWLDEPQPAELPDRIPVPLLVAWGEGVPRDPGTARIRVAFRSAREVRIDKGGRVPRITAPKAWIDVVGGFLGDVERAEAGSPGP